MGHAPRERVSWNLTCISVNDICTSSRSTWACELKSKICLPISTTFSSRSTWACELKLLLVFPTVAPCTSRSTWACELKCMVCNANPRVTRSRSTWACELKYQRLAFFLSFLSSRSTWACELKWKICTQSFKTLCHAPRERVSWNSIVHLLNHLQNCHAPRERVSWNFNLKRGVRIIFKSRSTWACELKSPGLTAYLATSASRSTWACELKWPAFL